MDDDFWGGLRETFSNMFNNQGFQDIGRSVAPGVAGAATTGLINYLLPGQGERVQGTDVRTGTGQTAEGIRLGAAAGAGQQYANSLRGHLDPREEYLARKRSRSADAASGSLETGGHAERESNAIMDQIIRNRQLFGGQTAQLTGGYQSLSPQRFDAKPNPWAALLSGVLGRGMETGVNTWLKRPNIPGTGGGGTMGGDAGRDRLPYDSSGDI
jgi:hypothetical protein